MKKLGFNELNVALLVILEPAPLNFLELSVPSGCGNTALPELR